MAGFKTILIVGTALIALISLINGAAIDVEADADDKEVDGFLEHHLFFRRLSKEEQYALMAMAISNYNYTEGQSDSSALFPTNPMTKPGPDEIPRTLFTSMMNGGVPKNFMTKFNNWIKRRFRLTNRSFDKFATTQNDDRLCRDEAEQDCIHIDDAGSLCCPFG